jgi:hypothetical protein
MSERNRPSLSGLSIKRPLPDRGKPVVSIDAAESALLGDPPAPVPSEVQPEAHIEVPVESHATIQLPVLSPTLLKAKQKEIKIAWTFKIPHSLHQELSAVATHNGLTMSDIVIEAIQFHLPNFPHPSKR